jgi:ribonucleases P/MRP protein subunit RPP40
MLPTLANKKPAPPCSVRYSTLPQFEGNGSRRWINTPSKVPCFQTVRRASSPTSLTSQLDILLPKKSWQAVAQKVEERSKLKYFRVQMSLLDVVSGDFFNQYIKTGNYQSILRKRD